MLQAACQTLMAKSPGLLRFNGRLLLERRTFLHGLGEVPFAPCHHPAEPKAWHVPPSPQDLSSPSTPPNPTKPPSALAIYLFKTWHSYPHPIDRIEIAPLLSVAPDPNACNPNGSATLAKSPIATILFAYPQCLYDFTATTRPGRGDTSRCNPYACPTLRRKSY